MRPQLTLEVPDPGLIGCSIVGRRQQLQPDRIELQSPQPEHPLQRHRKISTAFTILRREPAAYKDCHASRMVILLACSRVKEQDQRPLGESDLETVRSRCPAKGRPLQTLWLSLSFGRIDRVGVLDTFGRFG